MVVGVKTNVLRSEIGGPKSGRGCPSIQQSTMSVLRCERIDSETAASSNFTGWPWSYSNMPLTSRLTLAGSNSIPA